MNRRSLMGRWTSAIALLVAQHAKASADLKIPSVGVEGLSEASMNKALMQRIFADLAEARTRSFVEALSDDVVMRVTGQYSWSHTFTGKAMLLEKLYSHLRTVVADAGKTIPIRFIAGDDHVAVEARGEMVSRAGVKYDNEYCLVFRLKDGKIVEFREYCDSVLTERVLGKFPGV